MPPGRSSSGRLPVIDGAGLRVVQSRNARSQNRQLHEVAAVERQRVHRLIADDLADRGILGLQQWNGPHHLHGLLDAADFQRDVKPGALAHLQHEVPEDHRFESDRARR